MPPERAKPAVLVTITKQPNTNTLELTDKLDQAIVDLQKTLPSDVKISSDIFRQSRFIESSISNIQKALFEGAIFVVVVLFFFLMNVRTTIISLVALPLSLLVAILTLHGLGLTINTMSLGGLAIAIGSLVDDAIVDVENVYKRLRENQLKPAGRTTFLAESRVRGLPRGTNADSELDTDYRGLFLTLILPFRDGRTYVDPARYRIYRGPVRLNSCGINLDPSTM